MRIRVLFFGLVRDIVGCREDWLTLDAGSRVGDVFDHYAQRFPKLSEAAGSLVLARNEQFSGREAELGDGDEVALLPPVSGGSTPVVSSPVSSPAMLRKIEDPGGHYFALTREPLEGLVRTLVDRLKRGEDGAVVTFEGITRNNTKGRPTRYLDYECYEPMAIQKMAEIGREIIAAAQPAQVQHSAPDQIGKIGIVHRLGKLEIGEASVVIVVCSPHRRIAIEAAHEAIDRLKRVVPIWKKEFFEDGEVWVEGQWDQSVPKAGDPSPEAGT